MRRSRTAATILVVLMGCAGDPETSILPAGSRAIVVGKVGAMVGREDEQKLKGMWLKPGVRVTVGRDSGEDGTPTTGYTAKDRPVLVTVDSGEDRDASVSVHRGDLRPER